MNQKTLTSAGYHRTTSYNRYGLTPHTLDWRHQPAPVKPYPQLEQVPLERDQKLPEINFFEIVRRVTTTHSSHSTPLDIKRISTLFRLTHEVTARAMHGGQPFYYRSVASAGALYPFELYLAAHHIEGLDPGVYHFNLFDGCLTALRRGPMPEIPPVDRGVAATFFITGIFFRSAWKYRSRAYRYVLLDAGHLLENLRLALRALAHSFSIHLDFDDERAAILLGLDQQREVCLACVHLHADNTRKKTTINANNPKPLGAEILQASTVSDREVAYADILNIHRAGNGLDKGSVDDPPRLHVLANQPTSWIDLNPPDGEDSVGYARVLGQRRSRRNFIPASASGDDLMRFMELMACTMGGASAMPSAYRSALVTGCLAGSGMPVTPGFYLLDPEANRLGCAFDGALVEPMAAACLDQMWLKHAGMHLLFMTNLSTLEQTWGPRGYRYAMIEAGRLGQQAYLAATALGWGACGIGAIYDREAATLLDLTADGALLYLVGIGPVKTR